MRGATGSSPNSRSSIPGSSTRPLLRCRCRIRQGGRRRHPAAGDRHQSRPRKHRSTCCLRSGSANPELVHGQAQTFFSNRRRRCRGTHEMLGAYTITSRGRTMIKSARTRPMRKTVRSGEPTFAQGRFPRLFVGGAKHAVRFTKGTKAAGIYRGPLRRAPALSSGQAEPGANQACTLRRFRADLQPAQIRADAFYAGLQSQVADEDLRRIQRQASRGILWSKQYFTTTSRSGSTATRRNPSPPAPP